jgi:hypothetical protein
MVGTLNSTDDALALSRRPDSHSLAFRARSFVRQTGRLSSSAPDEGIPDDDLDGRY